MKRISARVGAFSLIEVTTTLAVVTFALIGLIGVLPVALKESRRCVDETRAGQLSRMIFSTMEADPFTAMQCFGEGLAPLDLSTLDEKSAPVVLFAKYGVADQVALIRADAAPVGSEYRVELKFKPVPVDTLVPSGAKRGSFVDLKLTLLSPDKTLIFEGAEFISRTQRGVQVPSTASSTGNSTSSSSSSR